MPLDGPVHLLAHGRWWSGRRRSGEATPDTRQTVPLVNGTETTPEGARLPG